MKDAGGAYTSGAERSRRHVVADCEKQGGAQRGRNHTLAGGRTGHYLG